jgi:hypothetical protein
MSRSMRLGGEYHFWNHIVASGYRKDSNLVIGIRGKPELPATRQEMSHWERSVDIFPALLVCNRRRNPVDALVTALILSRPFDVARHL